jgi:hypothetical protein
VMSLFRDEPKFLEAFKPVKALLGESMIKTYLKEQNASSDQAIQRI